MPNQHRPGYDRDYKAAERRANRRLRDAHVAEWRRYFDEEWFAVNAPGGEG